MRVGAIIFFIPLASFPLHRHQRHFFVACAETSFSATFEQPTIGKSRMPRPLRGDRLGETVRVGRHYALYVVGREGRVFRIG
ncbi:hypothetical protein K504DRAFT_48914 [Pleomassaria siparia CBS 279.74]|uniref:Uncharacterized protein n=1 Tax=Pleomassaria siparia CBS 279.74 TaxID=1314801 RepID=A0A6G1K2D2_9PLEO|nr:hypothetical protein K504DRAFT_48914 [Pleomassaria siparia CBS 279.74]